MAIRKSSAEVAPHQYHTGWVAVEDNTSAATGTASITRTPKQRRRSKRKLLQMLLASAWLGTLVAGSSGCTITRGAYKALDQSECLDEFMVGYRNRALAEKAWHCRIGTTHQQLYGDEYKDGFIDGYMAVAEGGPGCIPTLAPSKYWGWRYQSASGQKAVDAYFQGYPQGVKAADQDGVGHWQSVQVYSPSAAAPPPYGAPNADPYGVDNPFYSEEEIPMEGNAMPLPGPASSEAIEIVPNAEILSPPEPEPLPDDADSTFDLSNDSVPELIARRPKTPKASAAGQPVQLNSPSLQPPVLDAPASSDAGMIELAPADGSESGDALRFSFE